jgi:hypothetical protein
LRTYPSNLEHVRSVTNITETSKHLNGLTHNELVSKYVLGLKDKFSISLKLWLDSKLFISYIRVICYSDNLKKKKYTIWHLMYFWNNYIPVLVCQNLSHSLHEKVTTMYMVTKKIFKNMLFRLIFIKFIDRKYRKFGIKIFLFIMAIISNMCMSGFLYCISTKLVYKLGCFCQNFMKCLFEMFVIKIIIQFLSHCITYTIYFIETKGQVKEKRHKKWIIILITNISWNSDKNNPTYKPV